MKKTIFLILLFSIILISVAQAAPFLVCDPQTGITHYKLTGPAWVPTTSPAIADGSIHMDVSAATVGSNSLTVSACKTDPIWGEQCSTTVPFVFTRPVSPSSPTNQRLSP